mgnify:CR=1 FL=1
MASHLHCMPGIGQARCDWYWGGARGAGGFGIGDVAVRDHRHPDRGHRLGDRGPVGAAARPASPTAFGVPLSSRSGRNSGWINNDSSRKGRHSHV